MAIALCARLCILACLVLLQLSHLSADCGSIKTPLLALCLLQLIRIAKAAREREREREDIQFKLYTTLIPFGHLPLCVGQSIGGRCRLGRCMFVGKLGGRLLQSETLGKVSHVGDAHVKYGLQLLGKCRIELHPGDKGCKKPERERRGERE